MSVQTCKLPATPHLGPCRVHALRCLLLEGGDVRWETPELVVALGTLPDLDPTPLLTRWMERLTLLSAPPPGRGNAVVRLYLQEDEMVSYGETLVTLVRTSYNPKLELWVLNIKESDEVQRVARTQALFDPIVPCACVRSLDRVALAKDVEHMQRFARSSAVLGCYLRMGERENSGTIGSSGLMFSRESLSKLQGVPVKFNMDLMALETNSSTLASLLRCYPGLYRHCILRVLTRGELSPTVRDNVLMHHKGKKLHREIMERITDNLVAGSVPLYGLNIDGPPAARVEYWAALCQLSLLGARVADYIFMDKLSNVESAQV